MAGAPARGAAGSVEDWGGGGAVVDGTGGTGTGQPDIPAFAPFSDILAQRKAASSDAALAKTQQSEDQNLTNAMGQRGFSTKSPGFAALMAGRQGNLRAQIANNDLQTSLAANQYNAQNALPYAQAGLNQYNAEQDRAMRLRLAQIAGSQGLLQGLLV